MLQWTAFAWRLINVGLFGACDTIECYQLSHQEFCPFFLIVCQLEEDGETPTHPQPGSVNLPACRTLIYQEKHVGVCVCCLTFAQTQSLRSCRICLESETLDRDELLAPCLCRGSSKPQAQWLLHVDNG